MSDELSPVALRMRMLSAGLGIAVALLGLVILVGWRYDVLFLRAWLPDLASARTDTALGFGLAGVGLLAAGRPPSPLTRRIGTFLGLATALLGVLVVAAHLFGPAYGVGRLLLQFIVVRVEGNGALAKAPTAGVNFLLAGTSLVLLSCRARPVVQQVLALFVALNSALALLGYLYSAEEFHHLPTFVHIALPSALGFLLLALGLLSAWPEAGLVSVISSSTAGGTLARILLPAAILIPVLLGWFRLAGEQRGLYDTEFGVAVQVGLNVIVLGILIWITAWQLFRLDAKRRNAEQELARHAEELARSNADLEQFAYVASHDLQEPLRTIGSYLQLIERRYKNKLDSDADEFIAFAVDAAKRMQTLINDLLAYSRVGRKGKPFVETDTAKLLERALASLHPTLTEHQAEVTADPLPVVTGDEIQLIQVFQNLIANGVKFRGEQPPTVHVSARRTEEDDGWLFSVSDNGIGIDPQYADRIFVIFQRLHTRAEYAGTGIGLSICKKIVERHGGAIWVESQPEHGSTFYFTIPDPDRRTSEPTSDTND